jgi:hypothetical protein
MTDGPILLDGKPVPDKEEIKGIQVDANGEPVLQGTRMTEKESLERVIEGLKMVSDACAHLIHHEPLKADHWRQFKTRFDKSRRICVQYAGGMGSGQKETQEVRDPMPWRLCRQRFLEGVEQAAGGCRQLSTCFRGDLWWSQMATTLEDMARKLQTMRRMAAKQALSPLIIPEGYSRH